MCKRFLKTSGFSRSANGRASERIQPYYIKVVDTTHSRQPVLERWLLLASFAQRKRWLLARHSLVPFRPGHKRTWRFGMGLEPRSKLAKGNFFAVSAHSEHIWF